MKALLKSLLEKRGIHVLRALPRGISVTYDLRRWLPNQRFDIVFDVGANVGTSAETYLRDFPGARLWCFEPSARNYALLAHQFDGRADVTCERLALGAEDGEATLSCTSAPTMCHLSKEEGVLPAAITVDHTETVHVTTLDAYCASVRVDEIDLLKIDTEGHDLEVLRGGGRLLAAGRIACVQCECSMNPDNKFHVPFEDVKSFLEARNYRLFGIYEQSEEVFAGAPNLRRVNAVFLSADAVRGTPLGVRG